MAEDPAWGGPDLGSMRHRPWHHITMIVRKRWLVALVPALLAGAVVATLGTIGTSVKVPVANTNATGTPGTTQSPTDRPTPSPTPSASPTVTAAPATGTPVTSSTAASRSKPAVHRALPALPAIGVFGGSSIAQIAFGTGQDAYLGHTSSSVYVEINDYEHGRVGQIHAANSATKVLVYAEVQTEGPNSCQWDANPSWGVSYCYATNNHPEWFLLNKSGQRAQYTDNGYYMMDLGSPTYQAAWVANEIAMAHRDGFQGIEMDDVNLSPGHGTDGTLAKYSDSQYEATVQAFVAVVSPQLKAAGLLVSANIGNANPWDTNALNESVQIAASLSIYNHEFWMRWQEGTPLMNGAEWAASIHMEETIQNTGAAFTALTYGSINDVTAMRYTRGSFLLGWNGRAGSALIYRPDPDLVDPYAADWTTDVGAPSGARYAVGIGWRRDFAAGTVVINPAGSGSQTFDLRGNYRMPDGSVVSSVTLGPTSALVLPAA
ncbi:MAG: hypothetical protein DLM65_10165 [Candidatus Aeolococcus gillhamiae]|uniref:Uncharacterized protein n=1 Tax=Candidatus Aeolococcus gillhamiae TaxID=3127015 RepID=A0A2W5Z2Q9_9BACT|nr:MAG: hypothetical protein DLM65_10165 [Candidatus Dormibacter sp. RRmetagenome_bin12]